MSAEWGNGYHAGLEKGLVIGGLLCVTTAAIGSVSAAQTYRKGLADGRASGIRAVYNENDESVIPESKALMLQDKSPTWPTVVTVVGTTMIVGGLIGAAVNAFQKW